MLIQSLDDARKAVVAEKILNLCMADLDKWGFESPTQFFVVAIPCQADPEFTSIVNKSDGKVYAGPVADYEVFDQFGRDGIRVVESVLDRSKKALLYKWSRTMLETRPPYPEKN